MRMQTRKEVESAASGSGDVVRVIAGLEKRYQEELNRGFNELNEGVFKGLRRQLPVTRQRVEWDKVGAYRVSCPLRLSLLCRQDFANMDTAWSGYWRWPIGPVEIWLSSINIVHGYRGLPGGKPGSLGSRCRGTKMWQ